MEQYYPIYAKIEQTQQEILREKKKALQYKLKEKLQELQEIKKRISEINNEIKERKTRLSLINLYLTKEVQIAIAAVMTLVSLSSFTITTGLIVSGASLVVQGIAALVSKIVKVKNQESIDFLRIDKEVELSNKEECKTSITKYRTKLKQLENPDCEIPHQSSKNSHSKHPNINEEVYIIHQPKQNNKPKQYVRR